MDISSQIKAIKDAKEIQGVDGNWNYDDYMRGLYNGIEFALSVLENREPEYKESNA